MADSSLAISDFIFAIPASDGMTMAVDASHDSECQQRSLSGKTLNSFSNQVPHSGQNHPDLTGIRHILKAQCHTWCIAQPGFVRSKTFPIQSHHRNTAVPAARMIQP